MKSPLGGQAAAVAKAELAGPDCPEVFAYVWDWFRELNNARPHTISTLSTAAGMSSTVATVPLSFTEIEAWAKLTGRWPLRPSEVELLRELDQLWMCGEKPTEPEG